MLTTVNKEKPYNDKLPEPKEKLFEKQYSGWALNIRKYQSRKILDKSFSYGA
jgi:hypothetical protein